MRATVINKSYVCIYSFNYMCDGYRKRFLVGDMVVFKSISDYGFVTVKDSDRIEHDIAAAIAYRNFLPYFR